jgi:hypothetical protein
LGKKEGSAMARYAKLAFRYFDKVVFLGALVLCLTLTFRFLAKEPVDGVSLPQIPKKPFHVPEEVYKEQFVLNRLVKPQEPDATFDFTSDPEKTSPGPGEKQCPACGWLVVQSLLQCPHCGYTWVGEVVPPVKPPGETSEEGAPFKLTKTGRKPVEILFKGFAENPFKLRYDLQINWGKGETTFVPLGETFRGYRLYPLEKRVVEVNPPGLRPRKEERYFLTIQKPGESPLIVERGQTVRENEAYAILDTAAGNWKVKHRGELLTAGDRYVEVYGGYVLEEIGGKGRKFEVFLVKDNEVVLRDGDKEFTLKVS